ncbi:hypothetical protein [Micromonospora sp. NBRC 101691]|uniref:hypothetical protein n=1 Tax=Micromonospora sp. NBRC 101691 TaxID=3032198 RepID=UPI002556593B|nr:hypothetical protein [Micromonospora sp. NBRC 101691]
MPEVQVDVERAAMAAVERVGGGEELRSGVLAALHTPGQPSQRYNETIDLIALIVSVATLGWTVFWSLRGPTSRPNPEVVARRIRVELSAPATITPEQRDLVIDAVVEEILSTDQDR